MGENTTLQGKETDREARFEVNRESPVRVSTAVAYSNNIVRN